jgi:isocitrate dehydrogenase
MKQTDGLFHKVFDEIGAEYPDIEQEHWIIDIGAAKLADTPESFDLIVTLNLYGDVLSDVAAQIAGSVGLAGSANIGSECAMFEAIHGSAPRRAGQNVANPSGLLHGAIQMLVHIGQPDIATKIHNAWLRTLEQGIHTYDIFKEGISTQKVGTKEFAEAIVANLGQEPITLTPVEYKANGGMPKFTYVRKPAAKKELVGVDVFVHWAGSNPQELGELASKSNNGDFSLKMISNRGIMVWPSGFPETFCTDHWRMRYKATTEGATLNNKMITELTSRLADLGIDFVKLENLYRFDGKDAYSLGQGQ